MMKNEVFRSELKMMGLLLRVPFHNGVSHDVSNIINNNAEDSDSNEEENDAYAPVKKPSSRTKKNHPSDFIIRELNEGVTT